MAAQKFTRNKDYSDDALSNTGGRSSIDAAGLDGELDEVKTITDDHADKLDVILRDDEKVRDDLLEGHEFSAQAVAVLATLLNVNNTLIWYGEWITSFVYPAGALVQHTASGNCYICLVTHTSGTFATDLSGGYWGLFAQAGAAALPSQSGHADKVLKTDGSAPSWIFIGIANTDGTIMPVNNPTMTGQAYMNSALKTGKTTGAITSGSPSYAVDFNSGAIHKVLSVENNATFTTTNRAAATGEVKMQEVFLTANSGGPYTLTFPAGWRWVTVKPTSIAASKKAILSLRSTGTADTDIVAAYVEET